MRSYLPVFLACALFPFFAHAEVRINEVAWMGGNGSPYCEWIELYNTGDTSVDMSGWSFTINDTAVTPFESASSGDLVINPYGYYVITRKFSDTAASATTCHTYFENFNAVHLGGIGALSNTELSISLFDGASTRIDSIANGIIDWSAYSKTNAGNYDTVQQNDTGWSLGTPTPAGQNTTSLEKTPSTPESVVTSATTYSSSNTSKSSSHEDVRIQSLSIVAPSTIHAGVPITLSSLSSPKDARKFKLHTWNFGDFETSRLSSPTHTYANPGTYLIHLIVDDDTPLEISKTITVLTPSLRVVRNTNGDLAIKNTGKAPLDLSLFTVVGTNTFIIPQHSTILTGATLTIPTSIVQNARGVFNPNGVLVAAVVDESSKEIVSNTPVRTAVVARDATPTAPTPPIETVVPQTPQAIGEPSIFIATNTAPTTTFPAYVTLIILLTIAIGASLIKTRLQ